MISETFKYGAILSLVLIITARSQSNAQPSPQIAVEPITLTRTVADRIIRETPFKFQLQLAPQTANFDFIRHLDFGRTFGLGKAAVAYAITELNSRVDTSFKIQLSHNDGLAIWINNLLVYQKPGDRKVDIQPRERDILLADEFEVTLKKGANRVLIKSETAGTAWIFYLQPKGALIEERQPKNPQLGIANIPGITEDVAKISDWLILGPFEPGKEPAAEAISDFRFGRLYANNITWTIPRVEVFGNVINAQPYWGTYYNWNYHAGGVAWAMQHLSEATGAAKYETYANQWTDFMLDKKPFIGYQVNTLNGFQSTHHQLFHTPLLDFTAAPSMPFIHRLLRHKTFKNRAAYKDFVAVIKQYVLQKQIRLPAGNFTRETPEKYTTWTDDMFMGIPFIVQAALESEAQKEKAALLNDAAKQLLAFNEQVFDPALNLYRHAQYSGRKANIAHWSRANGWGIWATTEVLLYLPQDHPLRRQLMNAYIKHVNALIKLQHKESGAWHNVLDRPDSYPELSGTAIFTMCIARGINQGWLKRVTYESYAVKGWEYIRSCIDADGTVHRICVGTMSSENENDYLLRPMADNDSHGLIGLLFAGIEMQKLINGK